MLNLEKLQQWLLYTPHGRYTLLNERRFYHNSVHNVFGYHALQIGLPKLNFLQGNKISRHYIIGDNIKCHLNYLPFENNSIDLIVCPHTLEFLPNYYQVLQEFGRVLIPRGKLIITSFNRNSFLGYQYQKNNFLQEAKPLQLEIIKQQLQNLHFNIHGGKFFGYCPLINDAKLLSRLSFMDKIGDRWFPTYANVFGLIAVKDVVSRIPIIKITPTYEQKLSPILGVTKICKK